MRGIASRLTILLCAPSHGLALRSSISIPKPTPKADICPIRPVQLLSRSTCAAPLSIRLPHIATMSSAAQNQPEPAPEAAGPEPPAPVPGPDADKVIDDCEKQMAEKGAGAESGSAVESSEAAAEPKLPPLSPAEFKAFNRLAQHMDYFVSHDLSPRIA